MFHDEAFDDKAFLDETHLTHSSCNIFTPSDEYAVDDLIATELLKMSHISFSSSDASLGMTVRDKDNVGKNQ